MLDTNRRQAHRILNIDSEMKKDGNGNYYINEQTGVLSKAYQSFVHPISNGSRGGFDVHIYYFQVRSDDQGN